MTDSPKPLNRFEAWAAKNAVRILCVAAIAAIAGAGVMIYLLMDEQARLGGIRHAGPCRAEGIKDSECRRQARLIFKACSDQPARCAEMFGITVRPWIQPAAGPSQEEPALGFDATAVPPRDTGGGGGAHQPSHNGHQPPSPGPQPGPPAPSPASPPAPGSSGEAPGQSGANPGQSGAEPPGQSGGNHGQASGVGVEVCVPLTGCAQLNVPGKEE